MQEKKTPFLAKLIFHAIALKHILVNLIMLSTTHNTSRLDIYILNVYHLLSGCDGCVLCPVYDTGSVSRLGGGVRTGDGEEEGVISQTCSWSPPPAPTQAANEAPGSFHNYEQGPYKT